MLSHLTQSYIRCSIAHILQLRIAFLFSKMKSDAVLYLGVVISRAPHDDKHRTDWVSSLICFLSTTLCGTFACTHQHTQSGFWGDVRVTVTMMCALHIEFRHIFQRWSARNKSIFHIYFCYLTTFVSFSLLFQLKCISQLSLWPGTFRIVFVAIVCPHGKCSQIAQPWQLFRFSQCVHCAASNRRRSHYHFCLNEIIKRKMPCSRTTLKFCWIRSNYLLLFFHEQTPANINMLVDKLQHTIAISSAWHKYIHWLQLGIVNKCVIVIIINPLPYAAVHIKTYKLLLFYGSNWLELIHGFVFVKIHNENTFTCCERLFTTIATPHMHSGHI